jgi:hypothetical protein
MLSILGSVWIDGTKQNGVKWNIMEWSGVRRNGIQITFYCLNIQ